MNFVLQTPSLQQLAGIKIVSHLWSQADVFTQIEQSFDGDLKHQLSDNRKKWQAVEAKVTSNVFWALPLPKPCKRQLINWVKPLGMEMYAWCVYHNYLIDYRFQLLDNSLPPQLRWTMHGTVDYAKTAQLMVRDENLSVKGRYVIACLNCLEDEARQLITFIPEEQRLQFIEGKGGRSFDPAHRTLLAFCTRTLLGSSGEYRAILSFGRLIHRGSRATCEYLFAQLGPEEKERVLAENPMNLYRRHTDIMESSTCNWMYYLSLMNEEQQSRMFRESTRNLLICLLRWPLRVLFVEAAERGWSYMNEKGCAEVLSAIISKILDGFGDDDYFQLFWQCWGLTSAEYQRYFLNTYDLDVLFAVREEKFLRLILSRAPTNRLENLAGYGYNLHNPVVMDEKLIISDAALLECKETAALNSSKEPEDAEKRLRSQYVSRIVDLEVGRRMKRRL